jgi:CO/xanthine dehydrogenase FAD-binding subunit
MRAFEYVSASTVEEALAVLSAQNGDAKVLAGGTDLIVQLREGRKTAGVVVDIKAIPEANQLAYSPEGGLWIGAAVPCYKVMDFLAAERIYPGLAAAVGLVGGTQIQGRATIGGNLCNASPAADTIPALIVHRAKCMIAGPQGGREMAAEDFCTAPGQTVLQAGEFLLSIHLPPAQAGFGADYIRFIPRNEMDIAVAGAGASLRLAGSPARIVEARVALAAVAPVPLFVREAGAALVGREPSDEAFHEAARIAREAAQPIADMRGTAAQRKHLVGVLTRRALETAASRAGGEE